NAMGNRAHNKSQALDRSAGLAGKTDYQRFVHDDSQVAREDRVFGNLHRFHSHDLAETRQLAYGDFLDSFGSDVAQGHPGPAGREDELAPLIDLFAQRT